MRKSAPLIWATALAACVPSYVTKDGCVVSQEEQSFWEATIKKGTSKAYRAYLQHYPQGCYVARASAKLAVPVTPPAVKKVVTRKPPTGGGAIPYN
jgi:hypothetical protein